MRSICLMTCYMGPLPNYFGYFTATCKSNLSINFVVINDHIPQSYTDANIKFIKMNLEELNAFSSQKLGEKVQLQSAWKINELKPLFGHIFEEEFRDYDHWGWCDLDIIWGNIRHFLTDGMLDQYDVITTQNLWCTGHFTLFRNDGTGKYLYKDHGAIVSLLNDTAYYGFEECCQRWHGEVFAFEDIRRRNLQVSMFDIIKNAERDGKIRAYFKDMIREHPQPINYSYKQGKLLDLNNGEEFMYYHLITVKKIWRYYIPEHQKSICDELIITHRGIRCAGASRLGWEVSRMQHAMRGIRKSMKSQPAGELIKKLFKFKRTWV
jgi:hypothetical protein